MDTYDSDAPPLTIEAVVIQSQGFGSEKDTNQPESLISGGAEGVGRPLAWILGTAIVAVVVLSLLWFGRQRPKQSEVGEKNPFKTAVGGLLARWETGAAPVADLERFLRDYRSACSPALRKMIEQVVYSKNGKLSELKDRLRKEFAP